MNVLCECVGDAYVFICVIVTDPRKQHLEGYSANDILLQWAYKSVRKFAMTGASVHLFKQRKLVKLAPCLQILAVKILLEIQSLLVIAATFNVREINESCWLGMILANIHLIMYIEYVNTLSFTFHSPKFVREVIYLVIPSLSCWWSVPLIVKENSLNTVSYEGLLSSRRAYTNGKVHNRTKSLESIEFFSHFHPNLT